jgi:hypothetical protein
VQKNCVDLLSIIDDAATSSGQGFATVKVSSLGDPRLLKHLAKSIGASGEQRRRSGWGGVEQALATTASS